MTLKVGDKFTFKQEVVNLIKARTNYRTNYYDKNGNIFDSKTICEITSLRQDPTFLRVFFSGLFNLDGTPNDLPTNPNDIILCNFVEVVTDSLKTCTCDNFDLFNRGCRCGFLAAERLKNEQN